MIKKKESVIPTGSLKKLSLTDKKRVKEVTFLRDVGRVKKDLPKDVFPPKVPLTDKEQVKEVTFMKQFEKSGAPQIEVERVKKNLFSQSSTE